MDLPVEGRFARCKGPSGRHSQDLLGVGHENLDGSKRRCRRAALEKKQDIEDPGRKRTKTHRDCNAPLYSNSTKLEQSSC